MNPNLLNKGQAPSVSGAQRSNPRRKRKNGKEARRNLVSVESNGSHHSIRTFRELSLDLKPKRMITAKKTNLHYRGHAGKRASKKLRKNNRRIHRMLQPKKTRKRRRGMLFHLFQVLDERNLQGATSELAVLKATRPTFPPRTHRKSGGVLD